MKYLFFILSLTFALTISCESMKPSVAPQEIENKPVNTSLNGVWNRGDVVITIIDDNAVFKQINPEYAHQEAVKSGIIKVGDQQIRNIKQTDNLKWIGEAKSVRYQMNSDGKITRYTGSSWVSCTIDMAEDGTSIQLTADDFKMKYTRVE